MQRTDKVIVRGRATILISSPLTSQCLCSSILAPFYIYSYQTEYPRVLKSPFERHQKHSSGSEGLDEEEDKRQNYKGRIRA